MINQSSTFIPSFFPKKTNPPNIRSARIETKKNGAVSIVAENPKYPGITKEIPPISLLYRFVRRNVFQSQVGWEPRHREFEVDSSSIKCETGKFATREI